MSYTESGYNERSHPMACPACGAMPRLLPRPDSARWHRSGGRWSDIALQEARPHVYGCCFGGIFSLVGITRYMKADKLVGFFYQWDLGPSHDSAQLIDADNQILAMFPRGLSDSKIFTPNSHSKETSPRKHSIQLLDFTLVFPYLTSTPDVHLNVNSFRINWEEGPIKGLKPSKKLRKNQTVKVLLDKTLQKAKNKRLVSMPNGASTVPARPLNQHPPSHKVALIMTRNHSGFFLKSRLMPMMLGITLPVRTVVYYMGPMNFFNILIRLLGQTQETL